MPFSLSRRALTDSRAIIWLTLACLPTSRRKSSSVSGPVQPRLFTRGTREMRSSWSAMRLVLRARVSASSRFRSLERPPGSPIIPVAPPARAIALVPGVREAPQHQQADQVADLERVRARVAAVVHADLASLDPGAQRVAVGAVLDEAPGLKVGEKVHAVMIPHPRSWPGSIKGIRCSAAADERWSSAGSANRHYQETCTSCACRGSIRHQWGLCSGRAMRGGIRCG